MTAKVLHAELWGTRKKKHDELHADQVDNTKWERLAPATPFYLFTPQDVTARAEYDECWKVTDAMPVNVLGFQTHRDSIAIAFTSHEMQEGLRLLLDSQVDDQAIRQKYAVVDTSSWQLNEARARLRKSDEPHNSVLHCSYRPFDIRVGFFGRELMDRPRPQLVQLVGHRPNYCLLASRQQGSIGFRHVWVAKRPANDCVVSTRSREANQVFPMYLYPDPNKPIDQVQDWPPGKDGRRPNLAPQFVADMERRLKLQFIPDSSVVGQALLPAQDKKPKSGQTRVSAPPDQKNIFTPEDVFHYIYAVLHSPTYRERYAQFLKIDFPRIPLTSNRPLFRKLCKLGVELTSLHLMETFGKDITSYPVKGDNVVEKVRYTPPGSGTGVSPVEDHGHACPERSRRDGRAAKRGRVWINKTQYVAGVPPEVWEFHVGGYQVCHKWLKDRKGRTLSYDDIEHYEHVVAALNETIRLMAAIDKAIPKWPIE